MLCPSININCIFSGMLYIFCLEGLNRQGGGSNLCLLLGKRERSLWVGGAGREGSRGCGLLYSGLYKPLKDARIAGLCVKEASYIATQIYNIYCIYKPCAPIMLPPALPPNPSLVCCMFILFHPFHPLSLHVYFYLNCKLGKQGPGCQVARICRDCSLPERPSQ